jgi:hypothetical protein
LPTEPPVQAPTEYELSSDLKTAKALSLPVLPKPLVRADEMTVKQS